MSTISGRSALALADLSDDEPVIIHGQAPVSQANKDEALRQAQLELDAMKEQCRMLQEKARVAEANKTRRSAKGGVPDALSNFDQEVQSLLKKYVILVEMFPPLRDILNRPLTPNVSSTSPASIDLVGKGRYASALAEEAAVVAELDSLLPLHIQNIRTSNHFADQFGNGLSSGRSSELHKLRSVAGDLFNLPRHDLSCDAAPRRLESAEIRALLGVQLRGDGKYSYPAIPPLLYAGHTVKPKTPFSNWELLASILRVVFWGQTALTHTSTRCPGGRANGTLWQVTCCTPGCLAWAAVTAIFLVSPDSQFPKDGVGAVSKIQYRKLFSEYKRLFITNWDSEYVHGLLNKINQRVFGKVEVLRSGDGDDEDLSSDINAAMAAMAMAISDSETLDGDAADAQDVPVDDLEFALTGRSFGQVANELPLEDNMLQQPLILSQSEEPVDLACDTNETVSMRGRARGRGGGKKGKAVVNATVTRARRSAK